MSDARLDALSNRLILMSLNIQIELSDERFSLSHLVEIRQQADLSLVSSSLSHASMDELVLCLTYYCEQVIGLAEALRSMLAEFSMSPAPLTVIDDLTRGATLCCSILDNYRLDRTQAVQSMLSSPFREDAWHLVHQIDSNLVGKCRIIFIRLRTSFLLMYQFLVHHRAASSLSNPKKRRASSTSIASAKRSTRPISGRPV
jgi:hypothetical protein